MDLESVLPDLSEDPQDARGDWGVEQADAVVYRLGLTCLPVPGLPDDLMVGDVRIEFVGGPVRAQVTKIRQRFGLPVVFDKSMSRSEHGAGQVLALVSVSASPVPEDLDKGFAIWRAQALAAAGMLAAVLDERVVGPELFEDALLLNDGRVVGAADMQEKVRTYLPFEVGPADNQALEQLRGLSTTESSAAARAARLYRRAALEGPTADAYAMLWVAAECFSQHRSPSRKEVEAALAAAGIDPDTLPIKVGRLIELRGKIQHHGVEWDERLETAFYEMEAIVRALIRQGAGLTNGWWPASDNPAGFADPFDAAIAQMHGPGETEWHKGGLPPTEDPFPLGLPRRTPRPAEDPRIDLDPNLSSRGQLVAAIVLDAIEWFEPKMSIQIRLGRPPHAPADTTVGASATCIWISEQRLEFPEADQAGLVNFIWDITGCVGFAIAQRNGVASQGVGNLLVQAVGSWVQYLRFVRYGEMPADSLEIPDETDQIAIGKLCGWAAAGDDRARAAIDRLEGDERRLAIEVIDDLSEVEPAAPIQLLDAASIS